MKNLLEHCLLCGELVDDAYLGLCSICLLSIRSQLFISYAWGFCSQCASPLLNADTHCRSCHGGGRIVGLGSYRSFLKEVIVRYKFNGCRSLALFLASLMLPYIPTPPLGTPPVLVVPVPCSHTGLENRGWDQMRTIANVLSDYPGIACGSLLKRVGTGEQKHLGRKERLAFSGHRFAFNAQAFKIEDLVARYSSIVIIDDVYTTGTTIRTCMELIEKSVPLPVSAICLAMD